MVAKGRTQLDEWLSVPVWAISLRAADNPIIKMEE